MKKRTFITTLIILIVLLLGIFVYKTVKENKDDKDFERASNIMTLSYNKEFSLFYETLEKVTDQKISKEELIYNFAKSGMIPVLSFVEKQTDNKNLEDAFQNLGLLLSDYNYIKINNRENIFVKQANGKYYNNDKDLYIYYTRKEVITKKGFEKLYNEYLKSIKYSNTLDNLTDKLSEYVDKEYTKKIIKNNLTNHNIDFYNEYEEAFLKIISNDLNDFCTYVKENYFYSDGKLVKNLKKNIDSEKISISFKMKNDVLDTENLFKQVEKLNYPKIYF